MEITQPIGTFYLGILPARIVINISEIKERKYDKIKLKTFGGVQRSESVRRISEISSYCSDPDGTFPTPIIIAVGKQQEYTFENNILEFNKNEKLGEVIDGQHRIKGLAKSEYIEHFNLPVVFMFDLVEEEKAYVFSIINSTQTKVPMSLIYDLFDLTEKRSPKKTCHEMARLLNSDKTSPFHCRLKMLGKKETELASLSQGSFIKYLLELISKNPDEDAINIKRNKKLEDDPSLPLRIYFKNNKDEIIYKILLNLFNALREVFTDEWNNPNEYILSKPMGYGAILKAFPALYEQGKANNNLSKDFFKERFLKFQELLIQENKVLNSSNFPSNEQVQRKLADMIIKSIQQT